MYDAYGYLFAKQFIIKYLKIKDRSYVVITTLHCFCRCRVASGLTTTKAYIGCMLTVKSLMQIIQMKTDTFSLKNESIKEIT